MLCEWTSCQQIRPLPLHYSIDVNSPDHISHSCVSFFPFLLYISTVTPFFMALSKLNANKGHTVSASDIFCKNMDTGIKTIDTIAKSSRIRNNMVKCSNVNSENTSSLLRSTLYAYLGMAFMVIVRWKYLRNTWKVAPCPFIPEARFWMVNIGRISGTNIPIRFEQVADILWKNPKQCWHFLFNFNRFSQPKVDSGMIWTLRVYIVTLHQSHII